MPVVGPLLAVGLLGGESGREVGGRRDGGAQGYSTTCEVLGSALCDLLGSATCGVSRGRSNRRVYGLWDGIWCFQGVVVLLGLQTSREAV